MKTNKVLVISPSGNYYGSEQVLHDYLKITRLESVVFVPKGSRFIKILENESRNENISVNSYESNHLIRFYLSVAKKLLGNDYKAVYLNECGHIRYVILLARFFKKVNFVVHIRLLEDIESIRWGNNLPGNLKPVVISEFIRDKFTLPSHFIYDPYQFSNLQAKELDESYQVPFRIGVIGRVTYSKGIVKVFDLATRIRNLGLQDQFVISFYGDISPELLLSDMIKSLQSMDNVKFAGFVSEKPLIYQNIDCVLHCSDTEPLGRIYLESVDFGIPFIGVKGGGIEEMARMLSLDDLLVTYQKETFSDNILSLLERVRDSYIQVRQRVISVKPTAKAIFSPFKYATSLDHVISGDSATDRKNKGRVLHIIDSLNMGGAETWLVDLVKLTINNGNNGYSFDFLCAGGTKGVFDEEVMAMGSKVYYLTLDRNNILSFVKKFRALLRERKYAAIHDHQDFLAGWHFLFGSDLLPDKRVVHLHTTYNQRFKSYGNSLKRQLIFNLGKILLKRYATHIFGTSGYILNDYGISPSAFPGQKIQPFNCAFELKRFEGEHNIHKNELCAELGWDRETKIVLFAGRFDASMDVHDPFNHKNSAYAVHIFETLKDPDIKMVMVGANEFIREQFEGFLRARNLENRIVLLGVRKDMPHIMLASDILLFPSKEEALGMVAIEAQAAGLPIIASNAVTKEVIVIDELIEFCSLENSFLEWGEKLSHLMHRRKERDTSNDLRWRLSSFNLEVSLRKLNQVYSTEFASEVVKE